MSKVVAKLAKVQALCDRGATDGERKAARHAKLKLLTRHTELTASNPLQGAETAEQVLDGLYACWDFDKNTYSRDYQETQGVLLRLPSETVQGALDMLKAQHSTWWKQGKYVGPVHKGTLIEVSNLKFYSCVTWLLERSAKNLAA